MAPALALRTLRLLAACVLLLTQSASVALAQAAPEPGVALTPRGAVQDFLAATARGDYGAAADLLRAPGRNLADAPSLARQLRAVLDRYATLELDALSDRPEGRLDDGLAPPFEELARLEAPFAGAPVRMVRLSSGRWVLSRDTVAHIPAWYEQLDNRWLLDRLPPYLLGPGPLSMARWQWAALPLCLALIWLAARVGAWLVLALLAVFVRPVAEFREPKQSARLKARLRLLLGAVLLVLALPFLELSHRVALVLERAAGALLVVALGLSLWRAVDFGMAVLERQAAEAARSFAWGFGPLFRSLARIFVVLVSAATLFQWMGLPVASVLASLGLGGLAVALAARPTLESLLSAVMLAADKTIRVGDVVRIDGVYGTIEQIGLRSTRVRTLDRTLVSFPNGRLAELRIESFAARDRIRLLDVILLEPTTTNARLRAVLEGFAAVARANPRVHQDEVLIYMREMHELGIAIEVMLWLETTEWSEFVRLRQEVLLEMHTVLEREGVLLAKAGATTARAEGAELNAPS